MRVVSRTLACYSHLSQSLRVVMAIQVRECIGEIGLQLYVLMYEDVNVKPFADRVKIEELLLLFAGGNKCNTYSTICPSPNTMN